MKPLNLIMATLIVSLVYFGLIKYESTQQPDIITGFIVISFSLMYTAIMIVILFEAVKLEYPDNNGGQE
jgi:hypothetical protein